MLLLCRAGQTQSYINGSDLAGLPGCGAAPRMHSHGSGCRAVTFCKRTPNKGMDVALSVVLGLFVVNQGR